MAMRPLLIGMYFVLISILSCRVVVKHLTRHAADVHASRTRHYKKTEEEKEIDIGLLSSIDSGVVDLYHDGSCSSGTCTCIEAQSCVKYYQIREHCACSEWGGSIGLYD